LIDHRDRVARLVVGRAAVDDADAEVVLAHVDDAKLPVRRRWWRVLQNEIDVGLALYLWDQ
jgi:hypothetical protein